MEGNLIFLYIALVLFGFFCAYIGRWVWGYINRLDFTLVSADGSDAVAFREVGGKKCNIALYEGGNYITIRSANQVERGADSAVFKGKGWDEKKYTVSVRFYYDTKITVSFMAEDQSYYYTGEFGYSSLARGVLGG